MSSGEKENKGMRNTIKAKLRMCFTELLAEPNTMRFPTYEARCWYESLRIKLKKDLEKHLDAWAAEMTGHYKKHYRSKILNH